MLDKIKSRMFPCEQLLRDVRAGHAEATGENQKAFHALRVACGGADFSHLSGDPRHVVNPR